MRLRTAVLFLALGSFAAALPAQDDDDPRFRIGFGLAGGEFRYKTDESPLDGDTDAALFRLHLEAVTARGYGGGIRFETLSSDDDLFDDAGFPDTEARQGNLFGHFTYRVAGHRFAMPIRIGFLLDRLTLDQDAADEVHFTSAGIKFELAPEITLVRSRGVRWSLFGEAGFAGAGTWIDIEDDSDEYSSGTGYLGLEAGTRLHLGNVELGLSWLGRWQEMDESDEEDGIVVLGYDARFSGLMFTFAVNF